MGKFHNTQALLTKFVKTINAQSRLNKIHKFHLYKLAALGT